MHTDQSKTHINTKMLKLETELYNFLVHRFPDSSYRNFVFATDMITPADVVENVMLECIKKAYDDTAEKHSLRYFLKKYYGDDVSDDIRMWYQRTLNFVMKYRQLEANYRMQSEYGEQFPDREIKKLIPPDMTGISKKLMGYQMREMNFFELTNMADKRFVKAIAEKRLISTKKMSNDTFLEVTAEYDRIIEDLRKRFFKQDTDEEVVFTSLAAFTLEWKYAFNFFYKIAEKMDESKVKEIPDVMQRLTGFCGDVEAESMLGCTFRSPARMVTIRNRYIPLIVNEPKGSSCFKCKQRAFIEALFMSLVIEDDFEKNKMPLKEWLIKNTCIKDWASFFRDYDIFSEVSGVGKAFKKWNNKRIRYVRYLYSKMLIDY